MRPTAILLLLLVAAGAANAHPYLSEGALLIGDERSLPWNGETDFGLVSTYDAKARLVPDTLALLNGTSAPLVRFETLRRAALYLSPRFSTPEAALSLRIQLARRLGERTEVEGLTPRALALARFDAGCFDALCAMDRTLSSGRDGYALAKRALADLPEAAAEIQYVLARIAPPGRTDEAHAGAALEAAEDGTPLARNILRDWQHEYATLKALCTYLDRQQSSTHPEMGFPQPPPVPGANPEARHEVVLLAPAALSVRKAEDGALAVGWVEASPLTIRLEVGHRMIVGTRIEESVWAGEERVAAHDSEALLGGEPMWASGSKSFPRDLPTATEGTPVVLRAVVQIFETDIPGQHMWSPTGGRYRVLWERTYEVRLR